MPRRADTAVDRFTAELSRGWVSLRTPTRETSNIFEPPAQDLDTAALLEGITPSRDRGEWSSARDLHRA